MHKNNFKVSIVIPNYNGLELIKKNFPQVMKAANYKKNRVIEVIFVDDGSIDTSSEYVKKNFSEVKIIKHRFNRGFVSSANTGARTARGDLLALLNTDVIPQTDFLMSSITYFNDSNVFAVSLHEKGYGWSRGIFNDGFITHSPGEEGKKVHDTFWVSGGSGVFRRKFWMKLGGMDEKLLSPFYWEDVDISYRAAKRGWKLLWDPEGKVLHEHEATMRKVPYGYKSRIQERNQLILIWKNITSTRLIRKHLVGLLGRIVSHPGYIRVLFSALKNIREILKARRKEIKESKVSDEAIFAKFNNG